MKKDKYISCDRIRNGIDFELDNIEVCCFRCHKGGGNIKLIDVTNGSIDYDSLLLNREKLIEQNRSGHINHSCEECFNLEKKNWNEEFCIKYIHFNHWTYCNSDCIYCYTNKDNKYKELKQHYRALPILKEIFKRVKFSPDGEITFGGGEPTILDEFEELISYLLEIGAKKIIVHSSGVKYSEVLEKGIIENKIQLVISQDSGYQQTYKNIKNTDNYSLVWNNIKKYASFQGDNKNVFSKYVIIPKLNDDRKEIDEWLNKSKSAGIKTVIVDVEHDYYHENKNNIKSVISLLALTEYIKNKAKILDINVQFYNAARYLYSKYKYLIPFLRYKYYIIELLILSFPLLVGNLGHTLIGATDILVVAKYNINSLAAISIANSILYTIFILGIGSQAAISIILSNKRGAKQRIKKFLPSSLVFSFILAVLFTLICYSTNFLIDKFSFEQNIVPYIKEYIKIVAFSMFGMFIYQGIKEFLQAYEIVKFPNLLLLAAVVVNMILDIIFVFGFGPIPSMGSKGAAIATLSVRSLMGLVMLIYIFKAINFKEEIDFGYMKQLLKVGVPIGFGLLFEFLSFNIITILVGMESSMLAAIHNILITISSTTFTVPLSISTAVAIKVAYYYGAKNVDEIKRYSYSGLFMGVSFMAMCSLLLAVFPSQIIRIFTDNIQVMQIALPIVMVAAMYQIIDGFQVVAGGILKGFKMTKIVSFSVLFGYWFVGMPVAYILVFKENFSLKGYWIALAVSLLFMGLVQAITAKYKFNRIRKMYQE